MIGNTLFLILGLLLMVWGVYSIYLHIKRKAKVIFRANAKVGQAMIILQLVWAILIGLIEIFLGVLVTIYAFEGSE